MITITLDGTPRELPEPTLVSDLVSELTGTELTSEGTAADGRRLGVAVAVDSAVLPRSRWASTHLEDGAAVEVVTAAQGG